MLKTILTFEEQIKQLNQRVTHLTQEHEDLLNRLDASQELTKNQLKPLSVRLALHWKNSHVLLLLPVGPAYALVIMKVLVNAKVAEVQSENHPLKTLLVQVAWAAIKAKGSYYKAKYYKLKAKRGVKKAIVAIAHRIGKAIYNIIKNGDTYRDLGEDFITGSEKQRAIYNLKKKADTLGFNLVPCLVK